MLEVSYGGVVMSYLVEFPLEDGTSLLVESGGSGPGERVTRTGRPSEVIEKARLTFEEALDRVQPAAAIVLRKLRSLAESPDEVEIEFGLKLSAEAGAFIASTGVEGNYKVTVKWKRVLEIPQTQKTLGP